MEAVVKQAGVGGWLGGVGVGGGVGGMMVSSRGGFMSSWKGRGKALWEPVPGVPHAAAVPDPESSHFLCQANCPETRCLQSCHTVCIVTVLQGC